MLNDVALDVPDLLPRIIANHHIGSNFFPMIIDVLVQSYFQIDLATGKGEALANQGAGKTICASNLRSILQFFNGQLHGASLMSLVSFVASNPALYVVFNTERFALVVVFTCVERININQISIAFIFALICIAY